MQLNVQRVNSHIEIVVADTGMGILAEILPYVFDRFRQGDASGPRHQGGLGIGLAVTRHLVELHGGTVDAASPGENQGAVFTVKLPLMAYTLPTTTDAVHPAAGGTVPQISARLHRLRVLVVDDEADSVALLARVLTVHGADIRTSVSAAQAWESLHEWRPDLLICDINMPGENGYSLIRRNSHRGGAAHPHNSGRRRHRLQPTRGPDQGTVRGLSDAPRQTRGAGRTDRDCGQPDRTKCGGPDYPPEAQQVSGVVPLLWSRC